jgi:hypothetical protein
MDSKYIKKGGRLLPLIFQFMLLVAGCTQIAGYVLNSRILKGLGFSWCFGPLPTVFSTVNGVEGFDTQQSIAFQNAQGKTDSLALDRAVFSSFREHYFLKNAYSILLAYPHVLKREAADDGLNYMLCGNHIQQVFGLETHMHSPALITTRIRDGKREMLLVNPNCPNR